MCYSAAIGQESIQIYAIPVLILLHNVNALLIFLFSLQDFCSNSFQKYQDLPTSGAVDVEQFTINGNQFLAFYGASAAFVIKNETFIGFAYDRFFSVFKWSGEKFLEVHSKNTYGARDVKSFKMNGQIFLAIANYEDGSKTNIFKWNGNDFVSFQSVRTYGAIAWHPFVMCGQTFLGVANHGEKSVVYQATG